MQLIFVFSSDMDSIKINNESFISLGSIAGGGRYDDLVTMFDPKFCVPCVGLSIGVERLYSIMEAKFLEENKSKKISNIQVFIATPQKGLIGERLSLCEELWRNNIKV